MIQYDIIILLSLYIYVHISYIILYMMHLIWHKPWLSTARLLLCKPNQVRLQELTRTVWPLSGSKWALPTTGRGQWVKWRWQKSESWGVILCNSYQLSPYMHVFDIFFNEDCLKTSKCEWAIESLDERKCTGSLLEWTICDDSDQWES